MYFTFFSPTVQLFEDLENLGLHGTVRSDRKGLPNFMKKKTKLKKRRTFMENKKNKTLAILWKDNRHITLLTSAHEPQKVMKVKRKQKDGSQIEVSCPITIYEYTCYMRGVD